MSGPHVRTLRRALQVVGTLERLAAALDLAVEDLQAYISGQKPVPNPVFIEALEIVANGRAGPPAR